MSQQPAPRGMRTFIIIWSGQLVSLVGSGLTSFALGVWLYQETGSATLFALNMLFFVLPQMALSPFAGALVDRWDRRWAMALSDIGAALSTLFVVLVLQFGQLEVWHVYLATFINASFNTFQWPAYSAVTTLLVPKKHLGRAGGMVQAGQAISQIAAPAIAGALVIAIGLKGVITIDFATCLFAVFTLLVIRVPRPETTAAGHEGRGSLLEEATYGWKYIRARPGLLGLLLYFASFNLLWGIADALLLPMVLALTTADVVGYLSSIVGLGMLAGTLVMSAWGGPKRRVVGVLGGGFLCGLFAMLIGLRPSLPLITGSAFCMLFLFPILNASSQALWQSKVEPDVQGRVFAVRRMIAMSVSPLAYVLAGPLADLVFEPLLAEGGTLAGSVGLLVGVGPGRGIGLLTVLMGVSVTLVSVMAYANPRIRLVEDEIPDAVGEKPATDQGPAGEAIAGESVSIPA